MNPAPPAPASTPWLQRRIPVARTCLHVFASFIGMFILGSIYSVVHSGMEEGLRNEEIQHARSIGLVLFQYAQDHGGKYPHGNSSTDIFQQLLNQKYATDPTLFYFPLSGKSKAGSMTLKPENVCWDVTDNIQLHDPDALPVVFLTGYRIAYRSGGQITPLAFGPSVFVPGYTKGNSSFFAQVSSDGDIPVFTDLPDEAKGRTYRQLTPTGSLP